jgi:SAM-dependent methyltransferase
MSNVEQIREEEKRYHDFCYENYQLFEKGSWLYKPVSTVMDLLPLLITKERLKILDLGSGVGRNSIPIAAKIKNQGGKVFCVDLLDSAINGLKVNCKKFDVEEVIYPEKADIGKYEIKTNFFDFIIAVSSLEHVESKSELQLVLENMAVGTKDNGINCIIVNSEVEELDIETGKKLDAYMEVNLSTKTLMNILRTVYDGWDVIKTVVKPLRYNIIRHEKEILLKTNAITFVVKKT